MPLTKKRSRFFKFDVMRDVATNQNPLMTDGHLNDTGILLYTDALKLKRQNDLPKDALAHVGNCEQCRLKVFEYYEFNKDEPIDLPHPYFDAEHFDNKVIPFNWKRLGIAASLLILISAVFLLYPTKNKNQSDSPQAISVPSDVNSSDSVNGPHTNPTPKNDSSQRLPSQGPNDQSIKKHKDQVVPQEKVPQKVKETLAWAYTPIPSLDKQISRRRTRGFEVISPALDAELSQKIHFQWNSALSDSLLIRIFNQKTQKTPQTWKVPPMVTEFKVTNDFTPGLYYWEIYQLVGNRRKKIGLGRIKIM